MTFDSFEIAILIIILAFFSLLSYKRKSLTVRGIVFGNIVGIVVYRLGGMGSFLVTVAFFVVAECCTRYARKKLGERHEKRTTGNIFGNSGAAIIGLILGQQIAFFGAIATALADTISSEIGLLSKTKPRLITNLKPVEPGTDGGITTLGLVAGLIGAFIIGILYFYLTGNLNLLFVVGVAGFLGSIIDSFLGAFLEREGTLSNMDVNFIASLCGAGIAYFLATMLSLL